MAIQRLPAMIGFLAAALLGLLAAGCTEDPEGPPRVVAIGPKPRMSDARLGPLTQPDALLLQSVAQGLVAFDAGGNIVAGIAERWNVSNDGLSYIFRIAPARWADGSKVNAEQVARALRRQLQGSSRNGLRDPLGAVSEVVAMTDRVLEIRLAAPRPNLLALLAQPELAVVRNGMGTGPFVPDGRDGVALRLKRTIEDVEDDSTREEQVLLSGKPAGEAVADFIAGKADLVLGGTFADLPIARQVKGPRGALRFDPVSGLFGLAPGGRGGPFAEPEWRSLLGRAIDRGAFVAELGVPGLTPRATLLEPGLDGVAAQPAPAWSAGPVADRRGTLAAEARALAGRGTEAPPEVRLFLPAGLGADRLLRQLELDWSYLGLKVVRARTAQAADFILIDEVAPSASSAWFARRFRCAATPVCDPKIDELLAAARDAQVPAQRYALIGQAAALIDEQFLFLPIAAPVRWSLVGQRIENFTPNRFARHSLVALAQDRQKD